MKLRPSIHSFYNRVCAQQCSESLAVRNLMNWFSSGFCMYGLGHADGRAPHIFFFTFLFCASIVNTFYWISLNWIRNWRFAWVCLCLSIGQKYIISFFVWGRATLRENNMCDRGKTLCFMSINFRFWIVWFWWKQIARSMVNNRKLNICRHINMICTLFSSGREAFNEIDGFTIAIKLCC